MSIELLAFLFGILLIAVAIVGGGFEIRELKVPTVGRLARLAAGVAGVFFLGIGLAGTTPPAIADPPNPSVETAAPTPVDFTIRDELGDGQITEQIDVHVDGKKVGTLIVDAVHRSASLTVTVPEAGTYDYFLESTTFFDVGGDVVKMPGSGSGEIEVRDGTELSAAYELGDQQLWLVLR